MIETDDGPGQPPERNKPAAVTWLAEPAGKAALLLATLAALVITLVVAGVEPVLRLDRAVAEGLHGIALERPGLTHTSRVLTDWFVDPWTMRLLLAGAVAWLWHRRQRHIAVWAACASAVEWALRGALRWTIDRDRPQWERTVDSAEFAAMPSGHAMTTAATCVLLLWLARSAGLPSGLVRLGAVTAVLAVAVACFTRVFLGVHWLTDTLTGALLGTALATAAVAAYPRRDAPPAHPRSQEHARPPYRTRRKRGTLDR